MFSWLLNRSYAEDRRERCIGRRDKIFSIFVSSWDRATEPEIFSLLVYPRARERQSHTIMEIVAHLSHFTSLSMGLDLSLSPFDWTSLPAPRKVYPEWCECVCTSSLVPYSRLTGLTFLKFPGKQRAVEFLCRDKPVPHSRISMEEWERESAKTWGIYGTLRMSKHIQPFLFFLDESLGNLFALTARVF